MGRPLPPHGLLATSRSLNGWSTGKGRRIAVRVAPRDLAVCALALSTGCFYTSSWHPFAGLASSELPST